MDPRKKSRAYNAAVKKWLIVNRRKKAKAARERAALALVVGMRKDMSKER